MSAVKEVDGDRFEVDNDIIDEYARGNDLERTAYAFHALMCKDFRDAAAKSYYIPKDFALALSRLNKKIPLTHLPKDFIGYFHFAEGTFVKDDGTPVEGTYVRLNSTINEKMIESSSVSPFEWESGEKDWTFSQINVPLLNETAEDLLASVHREGNFSIKTNVPSEAIPFRAALLTTVINAVLYLHSQDPEILKLRPIAEFTHSKRPEYKAKSGGNVNECTVPITLLNWSYGQGRQFSVDSTNVQTHLRWQPCGPEFSQVKLIWVKEHTRQYKKDLVDEQRAIPITEGAEARV
jgi:hypothetical protein